MAAALDSFAKKKEYLVCVDSDGCAIDTMDIKHIRCFGPCMVAEWGLEAWAQPILERWNVINLYSMTRGINRFKGLAMALGEIDRQYTRIDGIEALLDWAGQAPELSNSAVERMIPENAIFAKALAWSQAVNRSIDALPMELKKAFDGAGAGLAAARAVADVAVVSSANREAVQEEWQRYGLLEQVDVLLCQDAGSKAHCIAALKQKGYAADHILMVGDAPGDKAAAEQNGVFYYPILVRREEESWAEFPQALAQLTAGTYAAYGARKAQEFLANLSGE